MCLGVGGVIFDKKKIWKTLAQNLLISITFEKKESFELRREKVVWCIEQTKHLIFGFKIEKDLRDLSGLKNLPCKKLD